MSMQTFALLASAALGRAGSWIINFNLLLKKKADQTRNGHYFFFSFFKKKYLFLTEGSLLYNIVLVSARHQHESATGVHMSPRS